MAVSRSATSASLDGVGHVVVDAFLVDDDALDELGFVGGAADDGLDLDVVGVDDAVVSDRLDGANDEAARGRPSRTRRPCRSSPWRRPSRAARCPGCDVDGLLFEDPLGLLGGLAVPWARMVAWISWSSRSSAFERSSPAMTTAVVVPSPTSSSWVWATSTIMLAAGCSMSISSRMVTPSFVTTTPPASSTSILSIPFGPSVVRTVSATAWAAVMFIDCASLPEVREDSSDSTSMG